MVGKGRHNPRLDPANYRGGQYNPGGWGNSGGGGGGGGGVHGEYNRGYGGWQFDVSPWQTDLAQWAARDIDAYQTGKTNRAGAHSVLFDEMKRDYQMRESMQRKQQSQSHQMDILQGMQQMGYFPASGGVIPGGYMPGQGVRSAMGMGGQQQQSTPSLMNFFSQMSNRTGRQMFPGSGFGFGR